MIKPPAWKFEEKYPKLTDNEYPVNYQKADETDNSNDINNESIEGLERQLDQIVGISKSTLETPHIFNTIVPKSTLKPTR